MSPGDGCIAPAGDTVKRRVIHRLGSPALSTGGCLVSRLLQWPALLGDGCRAMARHVQPAPPATASRQSLVTRLISARLVMPLRHFFSADWRRSLIPAFCATSAICIA